LPNTTYTYSFWYKFISTYGKVAIQISNGSAGFPTNFYTYADNLWHRATITITTGDNVKAVNVYAGVYDASKSGEVYITGTKLEVGNKATDWTPAPEDLATQSQISQLSDDINLRVQKGDVINQINVSTEGILIDGKKVHITGQTMIDNAVIKDAMIDSISANKLTAGTIDANVINVKNINASNIVTGTLDASKATVTNIDASNITTGTLNAARIAAGTIDATKLSVSTLSAISANLGNVTAGTLTGVTINAGTFNSSGDRGSLTISQDSIMTTKTTVSGSTTTIETIETFGGAMLFNTEVNSTITSETLIDAGSVGVINNNGSTDINGGSITTSSLSADTIIANFYGNGILFPWSTSATVLDVTQADCLRARNGRLLLNGDVVHTEKSMMIACGTVVITPSSSNTPTYKAISFGKTFPIVPTVVVTPNSTVPGTTVTGWGVTDETTTGCKIWVTRTNTTNTWLSWIAVADNTNWTATAVG